MPSRNDAVRRMKASVTSAEAHGLTLRTLDDAPLDGRVIPLDGKRLINFASCSYLGLEFDSRLREGVCEAVARYGTQLATSRSYLSAAAYQQLESLLEQITGRPVVVTPTTTLGHLAALPALVSERDAVLIDEYAHHSLQVAVTQLRSQGTTVQAVRHNRLEEIDARVKDLAQHHHRVWYLGDGLYSMSGQVAPLDGLRELLNRHEQLHLYLDDAHGFGWTGRHGRGPVLEHFTTHNRVVVALSLSKSFAAGGAAIALPSRQHCRHIRLCGQPMIFSGPIQPPMLGAAIASARIHLTPEIAERQAALAQRIRLCTHLMHRRGLRLASDDLTPIRTVYLGAPHRTEHTGQALLQHGFYISAAIYPAVPLNASGLRISLTLHHTPDDIHALAAAIATILSNPHEPAPTPIKPALATVA